MKSRLPPKPDFDELYKRAQGSANQRNEFVLLVGHLVFSWSNNESMFIYFLMILLDTDFDAAAVTFATLNTTRARLDLVKRLARLRLKDPKMIRKIDRLIDRFNRCTKVRNEFNHCVYDVDEQGIITKTKMLKIQQDADSLRLLEEKPVDVRRMHEVANTIKRLKTINQDMWSLMPELETLARQKDGAADKSG